MTAIAPSLISPEGGEAPSPSGKAGEGVLHFKCCDLNKYETENIKVEINPCTLYTDIDFDYSMSKDTLPGKFAPVHTVDKSEVPLNANYTLSIKTKSIPQKLQSKATIVLLDGKNNMTAIAPSLISPEGGEAPSPSGKAGDEAWITTETKYFGRFTVALDTVAPSVRPYNIFNNKNMSHAKIIGVLISDNLTGIKSYRATVDGKFILMEYEYKKALLFYEFDEHVSKGKHTFQVEVTDGKNNARTYKAEFVR
ncbi:MAG: hypothetical protein HY840_01480 [Bacteroidetes bacterium]|nr:hypothetical protein [Bacteroidota bacterium]